MKYLYLHGLGQNAGSWNKAIEATEVLDHSVCLDLSEMVKGKAATYSTLYSAFVELCDAENEEIILCGLSLGGVLALNYAIDYPQKVKALVLIATQYKMPKRLLKLQNTLFRFMPQSMFQQTGFGKLDFISLCDTMVALDFSDSLNQVSCPVLVVCGEKDKTNKRASIELADIMKHSQFKEIPRTGHEVNLESPEELASLLREFIKVSDNFKFGGEDSMFYNAKEKLLEIQDIQMNYITFGKGEKPLILIQGLSTRSIKGAAFSVAYMYRMFARDYKVYLFDHRENISDSITVRNLATDIAMAMDTLKITNADIFGVSQGGMIAQYLAIDRPDLVNQLVLAVTLSKNNETVERTVNDWIHITEQNNMKRLITDMAEKMYSDIYVKRYKPFMSLLAVLQKPKNVPRFIALAKACLSCKAYDELDKIQCPVFVIGGMQDKVVSGEASLEIAKKLGCEIFMYDDLGHAAYEEAKDFNQRVYNFLQHK